MAAANSQLGCKSKPDCAAIQNILSFCPSALAQNVLNLATDAIMYRPLLIVQIGTNLY